MKTLSVRQHWADAIFNDKKNRKDIENRAWKTDYRGDILIHASGGKMSFSESERFILSLGYNPKSNPVLGAIIGKVTIVDCVRNYPSPWAIPNNWHWILVNPIRCQPYYVGGALRFWEFDEKLLSFNPFEPVPLPR